MKELKFSLMSGRYVCVCKYSVTTHLKSSKASWIMLRTKFIWTDVNGAPLLPAPDAPAAATTA